MTILLVSLFLATFFLAYSNGANDNFKGVASLFGSGTANYKGSISWATITTFAGSVTSIFWAQTLVKNFSGKGLVPDAIAATPHFLLSVALGAAGTVMLATLIGFPISTTHSLTGALFGAGLSAVGSQVNFAMLGGTFFMPLLLSPFIAMFSTIILYSLLRKLRIQMGITKEWCVCVGKTEQVIPIPLSASAMTAAGVPLSLSATLAPSQTCTQRYSGKIIGFNVQKALDAAHYLSAGMVSFARGLNDTPKIVALFLAIKALGLDWGMIAVAIGMAIGGLFNARKVAETMSKKITSLNHGQGFSANLVTSLLVLFASRLGVPVSTTHVSVGSIFGVGLVSRQANFRTISEIGLSWVLTLPIAALFSALIYYVIH